MSMSLQSSCNLGVLGLEPRISSTGCMCAKWLEMSRRSHGGGSPFISTDAERLGGWTSYVYHLCTHCSARGFSYSRLHLIGPSYYILVRYLAGNARAISLKWNMTWISSGGMTKVFESEPYCS